MEDLLENMVFEDVPGLAKIEPGLVGWVQFVQHPAAGAPQNLVGIERAANGIIHGMPNRDETADTAGNQWIAQLFLQ